MAIRAGLTWKEISEKDYWSALECLPPAVQSGGGFLLGEPYDHVCVRLAHRVHEMPRYHAFVELGGKFYGSNEPMTVIEFKALQSSDIKVAA